MKPVAAKLLRCAIYTRVSTDHGLDRDGLAGLVERIFVGAGRIDTRLAEQSDGAPEPITVAWKPRTQHRRREIVGPADDASAGRPIRAEARSRLLHGIARGRAWLDAIMIGAVPDLETLAAREAISPRAARMTLSLASSHPTSCKPQPMAVCPVASACPA